MLPDDKLRRYEQLALCNPGGGPDDLATALCGAVADLAAEVRRLRRERAAFVRDAAALIVHVVRHAGGGREA